MNDRQPDGKVWVLFSIFFSVHFIKLILSHTSQTAIKLKQKPSECFFIFNVMPPIRLREQVRIKHRAQSSLLQVKMKLQLCFSVFPRVRVSTLQTPKCSGLGGKLTKHRVQTLARGLLLLNAGHVCKSERFFLIIRTPISFMPDRSSFPNRERSNYNQAIFISVLNFELFSPNYLVDATL